MTSATTENIATLDALLLLGPMGQPEEAQHQYQAILVPLCRRLALAPSAVQIAFHEPSAYTIVDDYIAAEHRRLVVVNLSLAEEAHQHESVFADLAWVQARNPQLAVTVVSSLRALPPLVDALADRAHAVLAQGDPTIPAQETALLLIGRGSTQPENNAEIARVARLLWEGRSFGWVETGYYRQAQPDIAASLRRCVQLGARQIIVVPYWLVLGRSAMYISDQIAAFCAEEDAAPVRMAAALGDHPGVVETLVAQTLAAATGTQASAIHHTGHSHGHAHPHAYGHLHTTPLLPPRYRSGRAVSAAPMGAAPLVFDDEGRVAWDKIWGKDDPDSPFCELALAGGPPHRGDLLEPVTPDEVRADWAAYAQVLDELTRGVHLTTGLGTRLSKSLGWIGVECESEAMAIWLLRAILVENVCARREGEILYLPAGPRFRLEGETKNVITALAKTHHYWKEHRFG